MRILNVAYPFAPVGPDAVGGAEQVLSQLDQALVRAGHTSIVVAVAGSQTAGTLVAVPAVNGELTEEARERTRRLHHLQICEAITRFRPDVVHLHGLDFFEYLPPPGPPVLVTLHLPPSWYPEAIWNLQRPDTYLHCVSESQDSACPSRACLLPPIRNGVDVHALRMHCRKRWFALAIGRICREKNFHAALDAGSRSGLPVLLAGEVFAYAAHQAYFRQEIVPRLGPLARYLGPIGFRRKRRLLSAARCLLAPSLAPETSSLVAMEALACGTPVIAFRSGALPEIIEDGVTGFLVANTDEMASAIRRIGSIDPHACRRVAHERFSLSETLRQYMHRYRTLARRENLFATPAMGR